MADPYVFSGAKALDASVLLVKTAVDTLRTSLPSAAVMEAVAAGQVKSYGTGTLTVVGAGNVRFTMENPSASAHKLTLIGVAIASTVTGFGTLLLNPTTGLPASAARPALNAIVGGGNAAVAVVKADTNAVTALSGGTDTGVIIPAAANAFRELVLPAPVVLTPGVKLGLAVNLGASFTLTATVTFIETPL